MDGASLARIRTWLGSLKAVILLDSCVKVLCVGPTHYFISMDQMFPIIFEWHEIRTIYNPLKSIHRRKKGDFFYGTQGDVGLPFVLAGSIYYQGHFLSIETVFTFAILLLANYYLRNDWYAPNIDILIINL